MSAEFDISNVVQRVLSGDQDAYREIIKEHSPGIRLYLYGHLKDSHKVDDLCQEVFIAVYWSLETYDSNFSFKTWIKAIAKNKLMSHFRKHYSHQKMMAELKIEICDMIDREKPFEQDERELVDQLALCINKQEAENITLLKQRYFEGVSVTDMAAQFKTTVSAISSQLYRLRKQLKTCIERSLAV